LIFCDIYFVNTYVSKGVISGLGKTWPYKAIFFIMLGYKVGIKKENMAQQSHKTAKYGLK